MCKGENAWGIRRNKGKGEVCKGEGHRQRERQREQRQRAKAKGYYKIYKGMNFFIEQININNNEIKVFIGLIDATYRTLFSN